MIEQFPYLVGDGPTQMARDEWLLDRAIAGHCGFRLYGWSPPTLSLGYFQPFSASESFGLPVVRRASGGGALVHHHELTYAIALPAGRMWHGADPWTCRMHYILAVALARFAVAAAVAACGPERQTGEFLCFQQQTPGDLLLHGHKIVGSAQRKRHGALLQHGGILLAASEHATSLPGIRELTGQSLDLPALSTAIGEELESATGWKLQQTEWPEPSDEIDRLAGRYRGEEWTRRR